MDHQLASSRYNTVFSNGRSYDHRNSSWPIASGLTDPLLPSPDPSNRTISIQPFPSLSLSFSDPFSTVFKDRHVLSFTISEFRVSLTSFLHSIVFYIIMRLILLDPRIRLENVLSSFEKSRITILLLSNFVSIKYSH